MAFQGERGAYSEEAVISFFKSRVILKPCKHLYETFEAAEKGIVDFAVVPVENSLEGSVNETYDLLLDSDLKVCGEINLRIHHALIVQPGAKLDNIVTVFSHPQALAQCRQYLRDTAVKSIATYDTAGSVKLIKRRRSKSIAAIASARAALIYGMDIVAEGIEDNPNNYTRFFVLSFKETQSTGDDKTSIIFSAKHEPGALYNVLKIFADREINLTKIESRPTREKPWEYYFYLDFEGHITNGRCRDALEIVKKAAIFTRVLGSYPKAKSEIV